MMTYLFIYLILLLCINYYYFNYINFIHKFYIKEKKRYTRWILSDKYVSKEYAKLNGFKTAEAYQLIEYPQQIDFKKLKNKNYVIKPCDLCDSCGVYLIKNNINIKTNQQIDEKIVNELLKIRSNIFQNIIYIMKCLMV